MRDIIVGDIHGCFDEFCALLDKVDFNEKGDRLVLLGDLMDRGPKSFEVLKMVQRLKDEMGDRLIYILGNHERYLAYPAKSPREELLWRKVGKKATTRSFARNGRKLADEADWVRANTVTFYQSQYYQCTHASIIDEDPDYNTQHILVESHSNTRKNTYDGRLTIVGHTPVSEPTYYDGSGDEGTYLKYDIITELPKSGVICIDTGCVYGSILTAMVIEDNEYRLVGVKGGAEEE